MYLMILIFPLPLLATSCIKLLEKLTSLLWNLWCSFRLYFLSFSSLFSIAFTFSANYMLVEELGALLPSNSLRAFEGSLACNGEPIDSLGIGIGYFIVKNYN
jgi:hypothetical protein